MLGEQYVRYDSDDILCLSPLDLPLHILPLFPVTPSLFPPLLPQHTFGLIKYFTSSFMAKGFFMKYDNKKALLSGCKSNCAHLQI